MIEIGKDWTLFIDRDGVINYEKQNDYIHTVDEFRFYDDVHDAFKRFSKLFRYIIVVTNQRGIGKGVTKLENLELIHEHLLSEILLNEGRIDKIYFAPELEDDSPNRKPNAGMAKLAKSDFPAIDFQKSMMIGNRKSDMLFGRNLGMTTVYLATTHPDTDAFEALIDHKFQTLLACAESLLQGTEI